MNLVEGRLQIQVLQVSNKRRVAEKKRLSQQIWKDPESSTAAAEHAKTRRTPLRLLTNAFGRREAFTDEVYDF
jgi:hypothetical protein